MKPGKRICASLKEVRRQIAEANEIPYEVTECTHEGPCAGTCPKCEAELRYIDQQLSLRRAAGKAVSVVGLSLGIATIFGSCTSCNQSSTDTSTTVNQTEGTVETDYIEMGEVEAPSELEGDVAVEEEPVPQNLDPQ